jgi:hypothetical protein
MKRFRSGLAVVFLAAAALSPAQETPRLTFSEAIGSEFWRDGAKPPFRDW